MNRIQKLAHANNRLTGELERLDRQDRATAADFDRIARLALAVSCAARSVADGASIAAVAARGKPMTHAGSEAVN